MNLSTSFVFRKPKCVQARLGCCLIIVFPSQTLQPRKGINYKAGSMMERIETLFFTLSMIERLSVQRSQWLRCYTFR